jgi:D-glycerate 3-kinase
MESPTFEAHVEAVGRRMYEELVRVEVATADPEASTMDVKAIIKARVYEYYHPVYQEVIARLRTHRTAQGGGAKAKPMVVAVSAPQGCGKTTLTRNIVHLVQTTPKKFLDADSVGDTGFVKAATLSMDDCYLTNEAQTALGAANPDNVLLRYRGNAGTHDLAFGTRALDNLININTSGQSTVSVPRYDKLAMGGRGDRKPESEWDVVSAPLDVILLEGWMLGFEPIDDESAGRIDPNLVQVNNYLRNYKAALWGTDRVDWWIIFKVKEPKWVYKWRLEAERKAGGGLSDTEVQDFVDRFMPAYDAYLPALYENPPPESLIVVVDEYRDVLMVHVTDAGPLRGVPRT